MENNEDEKKISPLRISPVFGPKLGEDQKKKSSLKFSPVFGPKLREAPQKNKKFFTQILSLCVLKLSAQVTRGGGACRNFAYYSMLIILSWRPKGGMVPCHL